MPWTHSPAHYPASPSPQPPLHTPHVSAQSPGSFAPSRYVRLRAAEKRITVASSVRLSDANLAIKISSNFITSWDGRLSLGEDEVGLVLWELYFGDVPRPGGLMGVRREGGGNILQSDSICGDMVRKCGIEMDTQVYFSLSLSPSSVFHFVAVSVCLHRWASLILSPLHTPLPQPHASLPTPQDHQQTRCCPPSR